MRKSSVGSAVLGLLAVTVASIGATGVLMLFPFPNDRALFGCAGAITAVLYFGYGRWIGSRQSTKVAVLVMILAAAVQVLWLVVLYGAVPEWLLGIAGCALPFAALVDGGTGSRELLALVPAFGNGLYIFAGNADGQQQFQQLVVRHSVAAALQISGTHTGSVPIPADFHLYPS